jgi:hypothetical protein
MRKILAFVMAAAVSSCSVQRAVGVPDSELSLSGISIGDTEQAVISRLGPPEGRVETGEGIELRYPGFVATVGWLEQQASGVPRRVYELSGTGHSACTPAGLCPGMPIAAANARYGEASQIHREAGGTLEYYGAKSSCWLQLLAPTGTVQVIRVACEPCGLTIHSSRSRFAARLNSGVRPLGQKR